MKTNNTINVSNILTAAAYVRNETIINGNQAAQLDAMIGQIKDLSSKIEAVPAKIAGLVTQGKEKAVAMWERMAARYKAQFADAVATLRAWLVDFKSNRPNVQINLDEPEDPAGGRKVAQKRNKQAKTNDMETIQQKSYRIKCVALKYFGMNSKRAYYYGCLVQIVSARMQHPDLFCRPASFADCMKYATEFTERNRK